MSAVSYSTDELLAVARSFPAAPRIMAELARLLRRPGTGIDEVAFLIKQDQALASRLLRMANSPVFAPIEPVAAIEEATAMIGFVEIHRLAGAVAVEEMASGTFPLYGLDARRVRENALLVALLLEELAEPAGEDPRAAYTIGLFRSLGKLAHEALAQRRGVEVAPFVPGGVFNLVAWEEWNFGQTGNATTAVILREWQVPFEIPKAIAEHYQAANRTHPLTHLLNLCAGLAEKLGYGLPGEAEYWLKTDDVYRKSGVDPRATKFHIDRAFVAFDRLTRALGH